MRSTRQESANGLPPTESVSEDGAPAPVLAIQKAEVLTQAAKPGRRRRIRRRVKLTVGEGASVRAKHADVLTEPTKRVHGRSLSADYAA